MKQIVLDVKEFPGIEMEYHIPMESGMMLKVPSQLLTMPSISVAKNKSL